MLSLTTEKSNKKKKCAIKTSPKIFKVPSLLDIASAYLANELLYEKCIQPATTGIFKSRWICADRMNPPDGCHYLTMGQWEAGKQVGWHLIWHCIVTGSALGQNSCGCCGKLDKYILMSGSKDWVALRQMTGKSKNKIVAVHALRKDYMEAGTVIIRTWPRDPFQLETKLFKCPGNGWQDGFELPRDLTKAFFPAKEIPRNF